MREGITSGPVKTVTPPPVSPSLPDEGFVLVSPTSNPYASALPFNVELINVFRDFSQGLYGNRIPLDDPEVLKMFAMWEELFVAQQAPAKETKSEEKNTGHLESTIGKFTAIEGGGAHPQVNEVFLKKRFPHAYRALRAAAPHVPVRPLWRAANGWVLAPCATEELEHFLTQMAEDVDSNEIPAAGEALRVKVFDSQGNNKEIESSIAIIKKLRDQGKPVSLEIAIPYSNGLGSDPANPKFDPYPDEFYINKFVEAAQLAKKHGIPQSAVRISLKDMAGELNVEVAQRLLPAIIKELHKRDLNISLGLHCHDTGLATEAYAHAIKACSEVEIDGKKIQWPIAVDGVECNLLEGKSAAKEDRWQNAGFTSIAAVHDRLLEISGNKLSLVTENQKKILARIAEKAQAIAEDYEFNRVEGNLSGEQMRHFRIPGGGFASFATAVAGLKVGSTEGLANILGITRNEALEVAGYALRAVGTLMGQPFGVTPGFQNKQIAALNMLKNMIEQGDIVKGMALKDIVAKLDITLKDGSVQRRKLTDKQVENFFWKGVDPKISKFLESEMPLETLKKLLSSQGRKAEADAIIAVHPFIRSQVKIKDGLLTDGIKSRIAEAREVTEKLQQEGRIKPDSYQAIKALKKLASEGKIGLQGNVDKILAVLEKTGVIIQRPDGTACNWQANINKAAAQLVTDKIVEARHVADVTAALAALKTTVINSAISSALEVGPQEFRKAIMQSGWNKGEPNGAEYKRAIGTKYADKKEAKAAFDYAMAKHKSGLATQLDTIEKIAARLKKDDDIKAAEAQIKALVEHEHPGIQALVLQSLEKKKDSLAEIAVNIAQINKEAIETLTDAVYRDQKQIIIDKKNNGELFLYSKQERFNIALNYLAEQIAAAAQGISGHALSQKDNEAIRKIIRDKQQQIESQEVETPMAGTILKVLKKKDEPVKKGEVIAVIAVGKMEREITARADGIVSEISCAKDAFVEAGTVLMKLTLQQAVAVVKAESKDEKEKPVAQKREADEKEKSKVNEQIRTQQQAIERNIKAADSVVTEIAKQLSVEAKAPKADDEKDRTPQVIAGASAASSVPVLGAAAASMVAQPARLDTKEEFTRIELQGYHSKPLTLAARHQEINKELQKGIVVNGNRAGCGLKMNSSYEAAKIDTRLLATDNDKGTAYIENAKSGKVINIGSSGMDYTNQDKVIAELVKLAKANPGETIYFDPGWGFLSEKDDFVAKLEKLQAQGLKIVFIGPNSEAMNIAGGKFTFREKIRTLSEEQKDAELGSFNPKYFGHTIVPVEEQKEKAPAPSGASAALESKDVPPPVKPAEQTEDAAKLPSRQLKPYVDGGFKPGSAIDIKYRKYFYDVVAMGGDVMLKAVYGGGGKGITPFKCSEDLSKLDKNSPVYQQNYQRYVQTCLSTIEYAEKFFGDGTLMTEQRIRGTAHHVEVQFAATGGQAILLGLRNCTPQSEGQKFIEMNVLKGDYSPELIEKINKAAKQIADMLAKPKADGGLEYKGLGTLELMVIPETGEVKILEVNPRLQVEHAVTEKDIELKTGKNISLPLLKAHLAANNNPNVGPAELMQGLYGIEKAKLAEIAGAGNERVLHYRINSKVVDPVTGEARATWFTDDMWPSDRVLAKISRETGATIVKGGLGKGDCDAQIGAIVGTAEAANEAMRRLGHYFRVAEMARRCGTSTSIPFALEVATLPGVLFTGTKTDPKGQVADPNSPISSKFGTSTVDNLCKQIKNNEVTIANDVISNAYPGTISLNGREFVAAIEDLSKKANAEIRQPANDNKPGFAHRLVAEGISHVR